MAGTKKGGLKAASTNKTRYGKEFYARIGAIGGKKTGLKGFALDRDRARRAGQIGGRISRRGKSNA
jgi:general stress protein YciG